MRRIAMALTYIKGPKVDGWANDMATWLDRLDPAIANVEYTWERFLWEFKDQFADSSKQQRAHMSLDNIHFRFPDIDQDIADFEDLARKARYTVGNDKTITLFLKGLCSSSDVFKKVVEKDPQNYFQLKDAAIVVTKTCQLLNALKQNPMSFTTFQQNLSQ
jgi:hypothetical protein